MRTTTTLVKGPLTVLLSISQYPASQVMDWKGVGKLKKQAKVTGPCEMRCAPNFARRELELSCQTDVTVIFLSEIMFFAPCG